MAYAELMLVLMAIIAVGLLGAGLLKVGMAMEDIAKAIRGFHHVLAVSRQQTQSKGRESEIG